MKRILFILVLLFLVSGCTYLEEYQDNRKQEIPLSIQLSSDISTVKSGNFCYLYLTLDNLNEEEKYSITAKIVNSGLFVISELTKTVELERLSKKTLEWKLDAPNIDVDTNTQVVVETTISKTFKFKLPILFANEEYLRKKEIGRERLSGSRRYHFSDSLVSVSIELNKEPPISGLAYGNIKVSPRKSGILDVISISSPNADCNFDKELNSASCKFFSDTNSLKEIIYEIEVEYKYSELLKEDFLIEKSEEEIPTSEPPEQPQPPSGQTRECEDTDGDNPCVKGTCTVSFGEYTIDYVDECHGSMLTEYYCEDNTCRSKPYIYYDCECMDGYFKQEFKCKFCPTDTT